MSLIMVITHANDDCANLVVDKLQKIGVDYVRFNTETFQSEVKTTVSLLQNKEVRGCYHFKERDVYFEDISAVWNRRVHDPEIPNCFCDPEILMWAQEESRWALNISFSLLNAPIINPWEINERLKFNKWIQMRRAVECGLDIPLSRLTNQLESIKEFWEIADKDVIFKKIRRGILYLKGGKRILLHTSRIPVKSFTQNNLERMRYAPMFLQEHISKKYDVRSVVIGENVFSVAIHSQDVSEGITDYRTAGILGKMEKMKHEIIDLGEEVNSKLITFTKSFGLAFSVIDLVITPDDRLVFLEDNPNGQWAWLEMFTGASISMAFAEYLIDTALSHDKKK